MFVDSVNISTVLSFILSEIFVFHSGNLPWREKQFLYLWGDGRLHFVFVQIQLIYTDFI